MVTREYKHSGNCLSILGFGCMRLPKLPGEETAIDEKAAKELVDYAYQHGINYFDNAWPYHGGTSERFLGGALAEYDRHSYYLATKMPVWLAHNEEEAGEIFNRQLENLHTDYIDFYLLHAMRKDRFEDLEKTGVYRFCRRMKEEGKIRNLGFSFHDTPEVLEEYLNKYEFDFAQIQFNYLDYDMQRAKEQYDVLSKHHLPVVVMEPVRGGSLADLGEESNAILRGEDPDASIASWALRFAMSEDNVMVVLSGMSTLSQMQDNIRTAENFTPLTDRERESLQKALDLYKKTNLVPCTSCRYCQPCPMGVDIPRIFSAWNQYKISKRWESFTDRYESIPEESRADHCIACGACMEQCPQHIKVPELLASIAEEVEQRKGSK